MFSQESVILSKWKRVCMPACTGQRVYTSWGDTPLPRRPLQGTVRILLECILVTACKVWGKVIFLHLSGILFTGGGNTWTGTPPGRYTPLGRYTPRQVHPQPWAGTPPGQVHPRAGTPPGAVHAGRYGQQAGGTHPTGMHSCCKYFLFNSSN